MVFTILSPKAFPTYNPILSKAREILSDIFLSVKGLSKPYKILDDLLQYCTFCNYMYNEVKWNISHWFEE